MITRGRIILYKRVNEMLYGFLLGFLSYIVNVLFVPSFDAVYKQL